MWFALGLVTLGVTIWWQLRVFWSQSWRGHWRGGPGGTAHELYLSKRDGKVYGVQVGYPVPDWFRFELKRESWQDRFFKWVGLSVERQFGEDRFDRLVYVASNDDHLLNRLADSALMQHAAASLFEKRGLSCGVRRVVCANGWLVAELRMLPFSDKDSAVKRLSALGDEVRPYLSEIAERLMATPQPANGPSKRDPYLLRAIVLLAISSAMTINGVLFLTRALVFDDAFIIDTGRLVEMSLVLGACIVAVLLFANFLLLAWSARFHLILMELVLVGSFGAVLTSAAELRDANIELDLSPAQMIKTPVVSKRISRSRKGGTSYHVSVVDWVDSNDTRSIRVSSSFYHRVQPDRHVLVVEQHAGFFGVRWAIVRGFWEKDSSPTSPAS